MSRGRPPAGGADDWGTGAVGSALLRALFAQDRVAWSLLDTELRLLRANAAFEALRPRGAPGADWFLDMPAVTGSETAADRLRQALHGEVPVLDAVHRLEQGGGRTLSLSCLPLHDDRGRLVGVALSAHDVTERRRAQRRLNKLYKRAVTIGGSLDVVRSARELVDALVPALGDLASLDVPDAVLQGREPEPGYPTPQRSALRRVAVKSADGVWPSALVQVGEQMPPIPDRPEFAATAVGGVTITSDPERVREILGHDRHLIEKLLPEGMRYSLGSPLYHRRMIYGYLLVWRTDNPTPFDEHDIEVLEELCARTTQAVDNALRYTREHSTAVVLQRSLLPPASTESAAAETAGFYLPTGGATSVGGDWFDALALSSLRVGLVVGDVVGHGLQATATMARLRTAVQTLADLDLGPAELLARLEDLVQRIAEESDDPDAVGASCLIAVYDPVSGSCQLASAGHPPPAAVLPDGSAKLVDVEPGLPLGVGSHPFQLCTLRLPPGSVLALYTNGLVDQEGDLEGGTTRFLHDLAALCGSERDLEDVGAELVARHESAEHPHDDITLLLARTRAVPPENTRSWGYEATPASVGEARTAVGDLLCAWGLEDMAFTTELIVSELVTNAVRYGGGGPVTVRVIRDRVLVCEVSDPSSTQPRLLRASGTDEGGRGLFLVAQLTARWGCRYGQRGKTIWTEQPLGSDEHPGRRPSVAVLGGP
jgi:PAS domain S-box-containing protein